MTTKDTDTHNPTPTIDSLALRLSEEFGMSPRMAERWSLAVAVARGRMTRVAGGWVPIDAEVILAIDAAMRREP